MLFINIIYANNKLGVLVVVCFFVFCFCCCCFFFFFFFNRLKHGLAMLKTMTVNNPITITYFLLCRVALFPLAACFPKLRISSASSFIVCSQ